MSEVSSSEILSNADASYGGTDVETLPEMVPVKEPSEKSEEPKEKSATDLIREVADNVQSCRVCYDEYHTPDNQARVLACGHSFCSRCVIVCGSPAMHTRDNPTGIKCPECRKVSKQAAASLPVNFQLMQILTVLSLVREKPPEFKNAPKLPNFDRLGHLLPADDFSELSMDELFEHAKVVFNAMRLRAERHVQNMSEAVQMEMNVELRRLNDIENNTDLFVKATDRIRSGGRRTNPLFRTIRDEPHEYLTDLDWMREMVVYRPPEAVPRLEALDTFTPPYLPLHHNYPFTQTPIEAILEREQAARDEADPLRNLTAIREAHFRRERHLAQQRETDRANGQLVQRLLGRNERWEVIRNLRDMNERAREEETETTEEDSETDSDESSFLDDEEEEERQEQPQEAEGDAQQTMTIGELVSIYQILNRLIAPGTMTIVQTVRDITREHTDLKAPVTAHQKSQLEGYGRDHSVNVNEVLVLLREHCIKNAETPPPARRRQRPAPLDENNALMSVIRRRARRALRGDRPTQPTSDEQSDLTMRLIVNVATSLGVRERLESLLCPHRTRDEPVFEQHTNPSTRQAMLFCTVCRCNVPHGSQQSHAQGRRHVANMNNRQN